MTALLLFAIAANQPKTRANLVANVFLWSVCLFIISFMIMTISVLATKEPQTWGRLILPQLYDSSDLNAVKATESSSRGVGLTSGLTHKPSPNDRPMAQKPGKGEGVNSDQLPSGLPNHIESNKSIELEGLTTGARSAKPAPAPEAQPKEVKALPAVQATPPATTPSCSELPPPATTVVIVPNHYNDLSRFSRLVQEGLGCSIAVKVGGRSKYRDVAANAVIFGSAVRFDLVQRLVRESERAGLRIRYVHAWTPEHGVGTKANEIWILHNPNEDQLMQQEQMAAILSASNASDFSSATNNP